MLWQNEKTPFKKSITNMKSEKITHLASNNTPWLDERNQDDTTQPKRFSKAHGLTDLTLSFSQIRLVPSLPGNG